MTKCNLKNIVSVIINKTNGLTPIIESTIASTISDKRARLAGGKS
jgi:hypothetical protein